MERNPALESAILANPEDADAYMVYADWLQGQGDPRGELTRLAYASFTTGGLSRSAMQSIAAAHWPNLEHLEVYFGAADYSCECMPEDVAPLLDRTDLTKLKYLGVKNAEWQNELVPYLARSPLVKQIERLDISEGILTDDVIADFEQHAVAFGHLVLDVSHTYLSSEAAQRLRKIPKQLVADQLREDDDPEYRFVCVGE